MREIVIVKLGGSLITDKRRASTVRPQILSRLCAEIAAVRESLPEALLVAHGSGSFGHVAAQAHGFSTAGNQPVSNEGISQTQAQAHRLHSYVFEALGSAGVASFSFSPASAMVMSDTGDAELYEEPVVLALDLGLVPVTFGDVVLDRSRRASVCSTEAVLSALADRLPRERYRVRRVLWMGRTDGVLGASGDTIPIIDEHNVDAVLDLVQGAAETDVTGGMKLRVETAWRMARSGITSQILNGLETGVLRRALRGGESSGTRIEGLQR